LLLLILGLWWQLLVGEFVGGDALPTCAIMLGAAAAFAISREITRTHGFAVPLVVAVAIGGFALVRWDSLLLRATWAPLGYSNATGSLFLLATAAALMVVARAGSRDARITAGFAAVAFAMVPFLNETATAAALVLFLPLALLARERRGTRIAVTAAASAMLLSLLVVLALGFSYQEGKPRSGIDSLVDATLSERRPMLWNDALRLIREHPLTGVGPGRFVEESPVALRDLDSSWPHNEVLHFGAETGIPGALLFLLFFAWAFARLWWGGGDRGAAVAAIALGAVGVHANVDYILHYPAIALAAAALVGAGSRRRGLLE
jgi:O-antigen ligase